MQTEMESYTVPTNWKLFLSFLKIGALTFGGGYVMVAIMYDEFCHRNKFLSNQEMERILMISQSLPGVMSVNTAAQVGYRFHRWLGGIICALGCMLPSFIVILLLAEPILKYRESAILEDVFFFIRACVAGLLMSAAIKMGDGIYKNVFQMIILLLTLVIIVLVKINPIALIFCAALAGYIYSSKRKEE